jgi:hypothetical protein
MREGGGVFVSANGAATIQNVSAMMGRQFRSLNHARRGADYPSPDHSAFKENFDA